MAGERTVSWQAVANFGQVAREAARAERALKSLKKTQQEFNASQPSNNGVQDTRSQVSGLDKLATANKAYASAKNAANKANSSNVKTSRENVTGQAAGYVALGAALKEVAKGRRSLNKANAEAVSTPKENVADQSKNYSELAVSLKAVAAAQRAVARANKVAQQVEQGNRSTPARDALNVQDLADAKQRLAQATRDANAAAREENKLGTAKRSVPRAVASPAQDDVVNVVARIRAAAAEKRAVESSIPSYRSLKTAVDSAVPSLTRFYTSSSQVGREVDNSSKRVGLFGRAVNALKRDTSGAGNNISGVGGALRALFPEWRRNELSAYRFGSVLRASFVPLVITGINLLASLLSPLAAGFISVAGAIAPVVGLLGTLPGLLAAASGGIVTLIAGFSGIGGALKAYSAQQKATTANTIKGAKADRTRAAQIASNAKSIRNAEQSLTDARRRQRETEVENRRSIADAIANEREAQRAVTEARKQAREEMERMQKSLRDLALQEEGESLSLEEARQRLTQVMNDPGSTDLQRRQANLAVRQAEAGLEDVRTEQSKTADDLAEANRKGVEGSQQVVDAKKNEAKAHQAVADAERNAEQQRAASQRAVSEATQNLADAQDAAARNQENYNDSLAAGSTQANAYADAMKNLTPEAQAVVKQLIKMKPLIDGIRATAQRGMMPGVLSLLKDITVLAPLVDRFIGRAARSFGDFFTQVGRALTTRSAFDTWSKILDSTNRVIEYFLEAGFNIGATLINIALAARPLTEWLARSVRDWTRSWKAMTSGEAGQKRLTNFFKGTRRVASQLGRIIGNLVGIFYDLGRGTSSTGRKILTSFEKMTDRWKKFTGSVKGQNAIKKWAKDAEPALKQISGLVGDFVQGIIDLGGKTDIAGIIKQIRDQLLPAVFRVFGLFTGETASHIVSILSNIGDAIATISEANGGGLNDFFAALDLISGAVDSLVTNSPVAREVIAGLIAAMAIGKAISFASALLGVGSAVKSISTGVKVAKGFKAARTASGKKSAGKLADANNAKRAADLPPTTGANKPKRAKDEAPKRAAGKSPKDAPLGVPKRAAGGAGKAVGTAEDVAKGAGSLAKALPALGTIGGIIPLVTGLGRALGALGPVGLIIAGVIVALTEIFGIFFLTYKKWPAFAAVIDTAIVNIKQAFDFWLAFTKSFFEHFVAFLSVYFQIIKNLFYVAWDIIRVLIIRPFMIAFNFVVGLIKSFAARTAANFRATVANIKYIWGLVYDYIIGPVMRFIRMVGNLLKPFVKATWETIKALVRGIVDYFNLQPTLDKIKTFIDAAKLFFKGMVQSIKDSLKPLKDFVSEAFKKARDAVGDPIQTIVDVINGGIIKPYIKLAKTFGIDTKVEPITYKVPTFKQGGTIPGTQSNVHRDNVLGVSSKGKAVARVEPGEFIMPRTKRKYFPMLEAIRQGKKLDGIAGFQNGGMIPFGKLPGYKAGGYYQPVRGSISQGIHDGYTGYPALDYATAVGNPVEAVADGRVSRSQDIKGSGNGGYRSYGRVVQVVSKGFETLYAHLSQRGVRVGQEVSAGQLIGKSGNTGNSTGPHLHFGAKGISPWTFNNGRFNFSGKLGAAGNSFASNIASALPAVEPFLMNLYNKAAGALKDINAGEFGQMLIEVPKNLIKAAIDFATKNFNGGSDNAGSTDDTTSGANQATGRRMMIAAGFSENQWGALKTLWQGESGWNERAKNPSSGAYGIPQALPASKMKSAGSDWQTNAATQIKWGLGYIKSVYGTPSNALSKWNARSPHWYATGTNSASRGPAIVGENGPELIYMNGGEKVVNNNLTRRLPGYNKGGVVNGMKEGASGDWVRALRSETHLGTSSKWTSSLSKSLKKILTSVGTVSFGNYNKSSDLINAVVKYLKKQKKNKSIDAISDALKIDQTTIWQNNKAISDALKKQKASKGDQSYFSKTSSSYGSARTKWLKALEKKTGESQDGNWGEDSNEPAQHMLYHAFGLPHDDYLAHPWKKNTPTEDAIMEQRRSNKLNAEFDKLVATFQSWNLGSLVRKMGELGPSEGLALGRDLAKNRTAATTYDKDLAEAYARSDAASDTASQSAKINMLVSLLTAPGVPIGLQGAAQALSLSLDSTAGIYDIANSQGRLKGLNTSRIDKDVLDFRKLFMFATGGSVPGAGSRDTVPAMLTPGEFVLRKSAVAEMQRKFGPGIMDYFNNIDRYNVGGFVSRFDMPAYRGSSVSLSSAARSDTRNVNNGRSIVNNINTTVNNPTLEDGAVSVQKRVTKVAQLGLLGAND